MKERLVRIETKLDRYHHIQEAAYGAKALAERNAEGVRELKVEVGENRREAQHARTLAQSCSERVQEIQAGNTWLQRLVIGAVVLMVIDVVLKVAAGGGSL